MWIVCETSKQTNRIKKKNKLVGQLKKTWKRIGRLLENPVEKKAKNHKCSRTWMIRTNSYGQRMKTDETERPIVPHPAAKQINGFCRRGVQIQRHGVRKLSLLGNFGNRRLGESLAHIRGSNSELPKAMRRKRGIDSCQSIRNARVRQGKKNT